MDYMFSQHELGFLDDVIPEKDKKKKEDEKKKKKKRGSIDSDADDVRVLSWNIIHFNAQASIFAETSLWLILYMWCVAHDSPFPSPNDPAPNSQVSLYLAACTIDYPSTGNTISVKRRGFNNSTYFEIFKTVRPIREYNSTYGN